MLAGDLVEEVSGNDRLRRRACLRILPELRAALVSASFMLLRTAWFCMKLLTSLVFARVKRARCSAESLLKITSESLIFSTRNAVGLRRNNFCCHFEVKLSSNSMVITSGLSSKMVSKHSQLRSSSTIRLLSHLASLLLASCLEEALKRSESS